jgi:phosphoglycolate phosphatase-like HAD superfamily hydrolase
MKLVMFDMDGTLTDGFALEENCYVRAIEQALQLSKVVTEWDAYIHTSASYCLHEIVKRARGCPPSPEESRTVQEQMVRLMRDIEQRHGRRTSEIPGASAVIRELLRSGYAVAIASGDWESTARHKLTSAGIPFENLPAAFCDCADARTEIMLTALARAKRHYRRDQFERVVYIGDAAWDVRACRELGWPLIGVGSGDLAARLQSLGVTQIISNYEPFVNFLAALEHASVPKPTIAVRA